MVERTDYTQYLFCKFIYRKLAVYKCSVGTSNATPERIFSRVTWQSRGRRSYMSMRRLDQVVRIQELGLPPKKQDMAFWRKVKAEL